MQRNLIMKTMPVLSFLFIFLILTVSANADNNVLIVSGGVNHHFSTAVPEQPASKPGFIDAYSISLQYSRKINGPFGVGFRTMFHNFNAMQDGSISDASIPVFFTMNYRLLEISAGNHIQLVAGPVFHLNSAEVFTNKELKKSFETGYGLGVFSGYSFGVWGILGVYAEGGLLYEKYSFKPSTASNANVTTLFSLGFSFNY